MAWNLFEFEEEIKKAKEPKTESSQITVTYQFDHTATSDEVIEKMRDVESKKKQLMPDHYVYKGFEINKNGNKYNLTLIYVGKKYKIDEGDIE
jgi:hypothetical protein